MYTYHPTHYPSFMDKEATHDIYNGDEYIASAQSESIAHTIVNALNLAEQISTTYIKAPTSKLPDRIMYSYTGPHKNHGYSIYKDGQYIAGLSTQPAFLETLIHALRNKETIDAINQQITRWHTDSVSSYEIVEAIEKILNPSADYFAGTEEIEEAVPPQSDTFTSECTRCGTLLDIEDMRIFCKNCW